MIRGGNTYWYHKDALGSVTEITDATGAIVKTYEYKTFGTISGETGSLENIYTYTGREYDPETGLYYYRARYYDSTLGRFLQKDPIGITGGVNEYVYAGNSPVNYVDPWGWLKIQGLNNLTAEQLNAWAAGLSVINSLIGYNFSIQDYSNLRTEQVNRILNIRKYFNLFNGINICNVINSNTEGPIVRLGSNYDFNPNKPDWGVYDWFSNKIHIRFRTLNEGAEVVARALLHELGHWANDIAGGIGKLNPSLAEFNIPQSYFSDPLLNYEEPYGWVAVYLATGSPYVRNN